MIDAVKNKMELNQMHADDKKWTLDQDSPFSNVQLEESAREMFNNRRTEREQRRSKLEQSFSNIISNLAEYPETSRSLEVFDPELDGKELTNYVQDLFAWIGGIRKSLITLTKQAQMHRHQEGQNMEPPPAKRRRVESVGGTQNTPPIDTSFEARIRHMETRLEWALDRYGFEKEDTGAISSDHSPNAEKDRQDTTARREGVAAPSFSAQTKQAQQKAFLEEHAKLLKIRMESAEQQQVCIHRVGCCGVWPSTDRAGLGILNVVARMPALAGRKS